MTTGRVIVLVVARRVCESVYMFEQQRHSGRPLLSTIGFIQHLYLYSTVAAIFSPLFLFPSHVLAIVANGSVQFNAMLIVANTSLAKQTVLIHFDYLQDDALGLLVPRLGGRRLKGGNDSLESYGLALTTLKRRGRVHTSSKTSLSLNWVKALHSTYLTAPRSLAMRSPSSLLTGDIFCFESFSRTLGSSRRSTWVPTIRQGTPGQWWCTSGNHFSLTFSNEAGDVTLKQTRKTSVWGYERGRSLS